MITGKNWRVSEASLAAVSGMTQAACRVEFTARGVSIPGGRSGHRVIFGA
jgi:hypothetical protein